MPSNPRALLDDYVQHLNSIFNQSVTRSRLGSTQRSNRPRQALIERVQGGQRLPLELSGDTWLWFQQLVEVDPEIDKVHTLDYRYVFGRGSEPMDESSWIFRYEYQRRVQPDYPYSPAHIHINAPELAGQISSRTVKKLHFPTGRVSIEQVLIHLILECDVSVLDEGQSSGRREEVLRLLAESHRGFLERRTDL